MWQRVLRFVGGIAIVAIGLVELAVPGPGLLVIAVGGALLARESSTVAGFLDWTEPRLRQLVIWGRAAWSKLPGAVKLALGLIGLVAIGGMVILVYKLW